MEMASQYFGFDDDETVEITDTSRNSAMRNNIFNKPRSPEKIPITEIQALLTKDLTSNDTTMNSTLNESSFYADEDTSFCQSHFDSVLNESISVDESLSGSTPSRKRARKTPKSERKPRKALGSIENRNEENENQSTPMRKKKVPRSASKNKENQRPKNVKETKKKVEDENYDELAKQLNKKFEEIENFQLVVE